MKKSTGPQVAEESLDDRIVLEEFLAVDQLHSTLSKRVLGMVREANGDCHRKSSVSAKRSGYLITVEKVNNKAFITVRGLSRPGNSPNKAIAASY